MVPIEKAVLRCGISLQLNAASRSFLHTPSVVDFRYTLVAMNKAIQGEIDPAQSQSEQILFTTDVEGNFRFVNAAGALLTGYSCEELESLDVFHLLPHGFIQHLVKQVRQALRRRCGRVFEIAITTRSGRQVIVETSLAVQRKPDRSLEFRGIAIEVHDVRRFAPGVHHEFSRRRSPNVACWHKIS